MRCASSNETLKKIFRERWADTFVDDGITSQSYTYGQFFSKARGFSSLLKKRGASPGQKMCLVLPNSVDVLALYISAIILGVSVVPIEATRGKQEVEDLLNLIDPEIIICENEDACGERRGACLLLQELKSSAKAQPQAKVEDLEEVASDDEDLPFLITFTSGSTGTPKGVQHSLCNLFASAQAFRKKFDFGAQHAFYHNLPMAYMAGILNLFFLPLISESRIVVGERFGVATIPRFWEIPSKYGANVFWFVPAEISLLLKLDRSNLGTSYANKAQIIGCVGTSPLPHNAKKEFEKKYGIPLYQSYGLSETLFVSTENPLTGNKHNTVGDLLEGVQLDFLEDSEILIWVPWMYLGYTNTEDAPYFSGRKYVSGDLGELAEGGMLNITGRKKDIIIKGGTNVSPRRIETFVESTGQFSECAVVGIRNDVLGEKIVCFLAPKNRTGWGPEKFPWLKGKIQEGLGRDYVPDEFKLMEEIPKNANGKIDKIKLRQILGGEG